jgi:hypothetical protein
MLPFESLTRTRLAVRALIVKFGLTLVGTPVNKTDLRIFFVMLFWEMAT